MYVGGDPVLVSTTAGGRCELPFFFFFGGGGRGLQILVFVRGWLVLEGSHSWCLYDVGCFEYQTL